MFDTISILVLKFGGAVALTGAVVDQCLLGLISASVFVPLVPLEAFPAFIST